MNFFAELKRRHIYRVGAAYTVVAWLLLQLVNNIAPVLDLPLWVARAILLLLVVGFPLALLLAWIVEPAPEPAVPTGKSSTPTPARDGRADWVLAGALAVVIAIFAYQQLVPALKPEAAESQPASLATARTASEAAAGVSIAVLPFANMSGDAAQEFFSDGMTEEITSALARVPDLHVVGRTSAFQFKGNNQDLRAIGQSLAATHLIEGSVRKAGDRLRITVQLIKADDGTHIWAEDYDRQLTDIFATQEDIARAIVASLRMPLGLKPGENLVNNRKITPEDYQLYLRAQALANDREIAHVEDSARMLEGVVQRNPEFAPALGWLGGKYFLLAGNRIANGPGSDEELRRSAAEYLEKQEAVVRRALVLDPTEGDYYGFGIVEWVRGRPLQGEEIFLKGLALDPDNFGTLLPFAGKLAYAGRLKEALAMVQKAHAMEPLDVALAGQLAADLWLNGQNDAAIAQAKSLPLRPVNSAPLLAMFYASMGRFGEAADALTDIASGPNSQMVRDAMRLLRSAPSTTSSPQSLPALAPPFDFVYLYVGAPERVIDFYERRIALGFIQGNSFMHVWHPSYAAARKTDRFKAVMRKAGLVDYWRTKGWPEFCHPTTADDFVCA